MDVVGRWWNGRFGRIARRDVWLERDVRWRVRARQGDGDSPVWVRECANEAAARQLVDELLARGADEWRDLTAAVQPSTEPRA